MSKEANMAKWISEFPRFAPTITSPQYARFFSIVPCPDVHDKELSQEWDQITKNLGPLDPELENLIGE